MKTLINYDEFSKMDMRVGKIEKCERKEGADKLLRLTVSFADEGTKNILSSLYPDFTPEELEGNEYIFIINLEPRKFMGELSEGMILCADGESRPVPLTPSSKAIIGSEVH